MKRTGSRILALAAAVVVMSAAAPAGAKHAVRCLKVLTREGTVTYCGGGYVDLNGNVYEKKKKAAMSSSPGPHPGPVQINHPVMINAVSHHGGGRH